MAKNANKNGLIPIVSCSEFEISAFATCSNGGYFYDFYIFGYIKTVLFGFDEMLDFYPPYVNSFYLFDCDTRALLSSNIDRWVCMSTAVGRTAALRFLYDGYNPDSLIVLKDSLENTVTDCVKDLDGDNIYLIEEIPYWKK